MKVFIDDGWADDFSLEELHRYSRIILSRDPSAKKRTGYKRFEQIHKWILENNVSAILVIEKEYSTIGYLETVIYYQFDRDEDAIECVLTFGRGQRNLKD